MQLNHTGYIQLIQINPQPYHIGRQFKSTLLEGPDASSKLQSAPGYAALNMLPTQRTARHPVHRKELCVHPPAPALLPDAPFHSSGLPPFSLVTSLQKPVSPVGHQSPDCTVVSSAPAGPVLWEIGSLCLTGSSPRATVRGHRDTPAQDGSGAAEGTGVGHRELLGAATATLAFPRKCLASLTNTEHPTQSTVTHTLPNACSECHLTAQNLLFLPKGDSPPRQPLPKLSTHCAATPAALTPQGTFCHFFYLQSEPHVTHRVYNMQTKQNQLCQRISNQANPCTQGCCSGGTWNAEVHLLLAYDLEMTDSRTLISRQIHPTCYLTALLPHIRSCSPSLWGLD